MKYTDYLKKHGMSPEKLEKDLQYALNFLVGTEIEALRLNLGLTQKQFAKKTNTHQTAVSRMERGNGASLESLNRIAKKTGMRVVVRFLPKL